MSGRLLRYQLVGHRRERPKTGHDLLTKHERELAARYRRIYPWPAEEPARDDTGRREPVCQYPAHRDSDWAPADQREIWVCGMCHPPVITEAVYRKGAGPGVRTLTEGATG